MKKSSTEYCLYRNVGNEYSWSEVSKINLLQDGKELHFAISKADLGMTSDCDFDFKWADNIPENPDILDFIDKGDVAPNGRFNYRYRGSLVNSGVEKAIADAPSADIVASRLPSGEVSVRWSVSNVSAIGLYNAQGSLIGMFPVDLDAKSAIIEAPCGFLIVKVFADSISKSIKLL